MFKIGGNPVETGVIEFYNVTNKLGRIKKKDGTGAVFHLNDVLEPLKSDLICLEPDEGDVLAKNLDIWVTYDIGWSRGNLQAVNVKRL